MKSTQYSEKVLDHFKNPRNVGTLEGSDVASGRVGNPTCGDIMEIFIKVKEDKIEDIKFQTFGCGSAVATSSMTTVLVKGMKLDEALKVTRKDVADELDGLPPIKMHCSNLAADALHEAINNYRKGIRVGEKGLEEEEEKQTTAIKNEIDYLGNGVNYSVTDYEKYRDQRVLILYKGENSIKIALELTKYTGRVVLISQAKKLSISGDLKKDLDRSDVKVLYESRLIEILGEGEVEKVKIHNLDEDEKYELFVDEVIIPEQVEIPNSCSV